MKNSFKCTVCSRYYKTSKSLKNHHRTLHSGVKSQCPICKETYATKFVLRVHMKLHNKQQFTCAVCGINFAVKGALTSHMITHYNIGGTGDEGSGKSGGGGTDPYKCKMCGKEYTTRPMFMDHVLNHGKTYQCQLCPKIYKHRSGLHLHVRKEHPINEAKKVKYNRESDEVNDSDEVDESDESDESDGSKSYGVDDIDSDDEVDGGVDGDEVDESDGVCGVDESDKTNTDGVDKVDESDYLDDEMPDY